jgi:SsrA-binding protein
VSSSAVKLVAKNRKALFDYEVVDSVEAGLVLTGTEVKSLRDGKIQFADAYAAEEDGEVWMHRAHIAEYTQGNVFNHEPTRSRKLLLHRHQIDRLASRTQEKGLTLIPLELYFKNGRAKVKLGLCRGKAKQDKRASIRERDQKRAAARALED